MQSSCGLGPLNHSRNTTGVPLKSYHRVKPAVESKQRMREGLRVFTDPSILDSHPLRIRSVPRKGDREPGIVLRKWLNDHTSGWFLTLHRHYNCW